MSDPLIWMIATYLALLMTAAMVIMSKVLAYERAGRRGKAWAWTAFAFGLIVLHWAWPAWIRS